MIVRVRIDGESESAERLNSEFGLVEDALGALFLPYDVSLTPGHVLIEKCNGDPDVSVFGNWKGRVTFHLDTQKTNEQIPPIGPRFAQV